MGSLGRKEFLEGILEDRPRPLTDGALFGVMEDLPLAFPDPVLTSRSARAPELMRRAKGEEGEADSGAASPSSIAFSSIEVLLEALVERLPWRARAKAEAWVGDPDKPPDRPNEVIERRRRC